MAANQARERLRSAVSDGIPALSPTEAPAWPQRPAAKGLRPRLQDCQRRAPLCWLPPSQSWLSCVRAGVVLPPKGPLRPSLPIRHLLGLVLPAPHPPRRGNPGGRPLWVTE